MAADFIILTNRTGMNEIKEYRWRISDILGYLEYDSRNGVKGTEIESKMHEKIYCLETPEEIDEMLTRAKHSEAAVVRKTDPADVPIAAQVYRYDEKEEKGGIDQSGG